MRLVSPLIEYFFAKKWMKPVGNEEGELSKSVYVPFTSTGAYIVGDGKAFYFQPDKDLDHKRSVITGIEVVDVTTNAKIHPYQSQNPSVQDNIAASVAATGMLVVSNTKRDIIATLPLFGLIRRLNQGKPTYVWFDNIIWQDCYLLFTDITSTAASAANGVWLRVYYKKK